jgi:predicted NBD/HSP70 family sugar kinase
MSPEPGPLYGGVEGGGTKFVCVVGTGPDDVRAEARLPTTGPEETIGRAIAFFRDEQTRVGPLAGIGIGRSACRPQPASRTSLITTPAADERRLQMFRHSWGSRWRSTPT